jgi:hypothetical protein
LAGVVEGGDEVEVAEIKAEKGGVGRGEHTVEKKFCSGEIRRGCVCFALVVNKIASYGEADAVGIGFLGAMIGTYS